MEIGTTTVSGVRRVAGSTVNVPQVEPYAAPAITGFDLSGLVGMTTHANGSGSSSDQGTDSFFQPNTGHIGGSAVDQPAEPAR